MPDLSRITLVPNRPGWHAEKLLEDCGIKRPPVDQCCILDRLNLKVEEFLFGECPAMEGWDDDNPGEVAILRPERRLIYVHRNTIPTRKRMSIFHECGHFHLPWHRGVNYLCDERALGPLVRNRLERQAFEFASCVLMPRRMFVEDILNLPMGLDAVYRLKRRYEASFLAAALWYAKVHPGRCIFVCMGPSTKREGKRVVADGSRNLRVHYSFPSARFPTFIKGGVEVRAGTRLHALWLGTRSRLGIIQGEVPMTDYGPSYWDHKYVVKAECRAYGNDGTMLGLLWLPDKQLKLGL